MQRGELTTLDMDAIAHETAERTPAAWERFGKL